MYVKVPILNSVPHWNCSVDQTEHSMLHCVMLSFYFSDSEDYSWPIWPQNPLCTSTFWYVFFCVLMICKCTIIGNIQPQGMLSFPPFQLRSCSPWVMKSGVPSSHSSVHSLNSRNPLLIPHPPRVLMLPNPQLLGPGSTCCAISAVWLDMKLLLTGWLTQHW